MFSNSSKNSLSDCFSRVIIFFQRKRCPYLLKSCFELHSETNPVQFSLVEIISLFAHSPLTTEKSFEMKCIGSAKKVHKNKLRTELSIQMSSSPGYLQAQDSTVMFGYTLSTTFLFSSKNKILSEDIFSGTQQGSGIPGTTPTALTMLWMVA